MRFIPSPSLMHDPLVAQWTLRAWKRAEDAGDEPSARALLALFDPPTLERHLEGPDPILASGLLHRLPPSAVAPVAPLMLARWQDWDTTRAGWAAEALGRVAPDQALPSFLAWVREAHPIHDASRLKGVARATVAMGAAGAELARAILARCSDPGGIPLGDDVAVRLAVHAGASRAAALIGYRLRERAEDPGGVHPEYTIQGIVAAAFSAATAGSPLLALLVDLAHYGREHTPLLLSPLFIDPVRAEAALKLLLRPGRQGLRGLESMLSEASAHRSLVLDIAAGLAQELVREAELEALLVEPLRLFLAAALLSPEIDPDPDLAKLSTPQIVSLAALDIRELPHEERVIRALAELDPKEREPILGHFFHVHHQRPAAARLVRAMGLAGDPQFASDLIELGLGSEDDTVREASELALIRIGQPAVRTLIETWDSLEGARLYHAWSVLQGVGGAAAIEHLMERWPAEKGDLILLESLCVTASALPDRRLVELLERELPREAACVEEAWVALCLLLGLERPGLAALAARLEERRSRNYAGIHALLGGGDSTPIDPGEMRIPLACARCGEQNNFRVTALWLDPASPSDRPHIGDDLRCPSCGERGPFDNVPMSSLTLMAELGRMCAADEQGREYAGPLRLLTTTTMEGWSGSPPALVRRYEARLAENPDDISSLLGLGNLCHKLGPRRRARELFQRCLVHDPACVEAALNLAHIDREAGEPECALTWFREVWPHRAAWTLYRIKREAEPSFLKAALGLHDELAAALGEPMLPPDDARSIRLIRSDAARRVSVEERIEARKNRSSQRRQHKQSRAGKRRR